MIFESNGHNTLLMQVRINTLETKYLLISHTQCNVLTSTTIEL